MRNSKGQFIKGSTIRKDSKVSEETKKKISETLKKNPVRYWLGKKRPGIGKNLIEHTKINGTWNKGVKGKQSWHNISGLNTHGHIPHNKGKKSSPETIEKIKKARALQKNAGFQKGDKHPNWKGGVTAFRQEVYNTHTYKKWRLNCFTRDNFICQICGCNKKRIMQVDHIKAYSLIIHENKITTIEQAMQCSELWDLSNGRTLCIPCHQKTDNYGSKAIIRKH